MSALKKLLTSAQSGRIARLMLFTLISAAVSVPLVQQWEVRYPVLGAIIGLLEGLYRAAVPTQPVPKATAESVPQVSPGGDGG